MEQCQGGRGVGECRGQGLMSMLTKLFPVLPAVHTLKDVISLGLSSSQPHLFSIEHKFGLLKDAFMISVSLNYNFFETFIFPFTEFHFVVFCLSKRRCYVTAVCSLRALRFLVLHQCLV